MKISVIISVYNHFEWLRLILDALGMQSAPDSEVIIADDGSSEDLQNSLAEYSEQHKNLRIVHVWQEDLGWRKNIALNAAVRAASGDYLIFIDGDCIPHPDFISDHVRLSAPGRVVAGRRIDLPAGISDKVEKMKELPADYFHQIRKQIVKSLFSSFSESARVLKRLVRLPIKNGHVAGMKPGGILGCNFSLYRVDFEKVNGFDERYLNPGVGEDTDIDMRLSNAGVQAMKVSRAALMFHRHHPRLPLDSEENRKLLEENRLGHATRVSTGLVRDTHS